MTIEDHPDVTEEDPTERALRELFGPVELATAPETTDRPDEIAMARKALAPIKASLEAAGFYAYGTFDDQHRWVIAADDEAGRVDVRVGDDGYHVELWASSPGLFVDEENEFRRRAHERLARMTLPRITQGMLASHQSAEWDEVDQGVAVRLRYEVPFARAEEIGELVRGHLPELDELLGFVESRVVS
ncbi:MAG: hypothetical protein ACRDJW_06575 [Thermomicrobiales bacterium]